MTKILTEEETIILIGQFMDGMSRTVTEEEITLLISWAEKARLDAQALQQLLDRKAVIRLSNKTRVTRQIVPDGIFEMELKK